MDQIKRTPVVLVLLAWLFVGVPWAWGVEQLWKNARKLFQSPPATTHACGSGQSGSACATGREVTKRASLLDCHCCLEGFHCSLRMVDSSRKGATIFLRPIW